MKYPVADYIAFLDSFHNSVWAHSHLESHRSYLIRNRKQVENTVHRSYYLLTLSVCFYRSAHFPGNAMRQKNNKLVYARLYPNAADMTDLRESLECLATFVLSETPKPAF